MKPVGTTSTNINIVANQASTSDLGKYASGSDQIQTTAPTILQNEVRPVYQAFDGIHPGKSSSVAEASGSYASTYKKSVDKLFGINNVGLQMMNSNGMGPVRNHASFGPSSGQVNGVTIGS